MDVTVFHIILNKLQTQLDIWLNRQSHFILCTDQKLLILFLFQMPQMVVWFHWLAMGLWEFFTFREPPHIKC